MHSTSKRVSKITGHTAVYGIIGEHVQHSFSPAMHTAAMRHDGRNALYLAFPVARGNVEVAVNGLQAIGVRGINVTMPYKRDVIPLLATIEEAAAVIGAVNTIRFLDDGLHGNNTDWSGFLADLKLHEVDVDGRDCVVLGAGGSARAIVYALLTAGATVHLLARRLTQAAELKADFGQHINVNSLHPHLLSDLGELVLSRPLIVNTTPLGMYPNVESSAWPADVPLPAGAFIYDIVYNPETTQIMQQGIDAGCQAANGLGMLLYQGVHAYTYWMGESPDAAVMRVALLDALNTPAD